MIIPFSRGSQVVKDRSGNEGSSTISKYYLVVVILAQAFHVTYQYFLKLCRGWPEAEKSPTEFSADSGVAAFKPLSPGITN